jgi:hypothetical protein
MNKLLTKALVASMFFVLATGTTAFAQMFEGSIDANIPFRFYAGDTWLPAGKYTIRVPDKEQPNILLIQNANDTVEVFLVTESTTRATAASEPSMDFDKLGNKDFLSTIWVGEHTTGYQLEEPRLEKKLEKAAVKKEKHSVKAHHTKP